MNIHEYQAKELLREFGVAVPSGKVAFTVDEAVKAAESLKGNIHVVKSQIHAGGRGAGHFQNDTSGKGGVRVCTSIDAVKDAASSMLNKILITKQTGDNGKQVKRLYIEEGCDIARELYLSLLIDRVTSSVTIVTSAEGGMEIEDVAEKNPEKILKIAIDPATGFMGHHGRTVAYFLGLEANQVKSCVSFLNAMYKAFLALDASMIEINPLVITGTGDVIALDAKMNFDSNALYRQKNVADMRDEDEEDPAELEAAKYDLNYITLDGNIGCMVNGAGLAMATMDIITLKGESPANFLDVGGGATVDRVSQAFRIILSDSNVAGILVNIFGGIMRCDVIANGIIEAARNLSIDKPLVVRLEGTNVDLGKKLLNESGLSITAADNLEDAANKIVALVKNI